MKAFVILFLIHISFNAFAQTNRNPKYYLNGTEVNFENIFICPNSIKSMEVKRETPNGDIYIVTKDKNWKHKSLEKFLRSFSNYKEIYNNSFIPVFMISKRVINNPESAQIDSSYFGEATISNLSGVKGISGDCVKQIIVYIELANNPIIHLRGETSVYPDTIKQK